MEVMAEATTAGRHSKGTQDRLDRHRPNSLLLLGPQVEIYRVHLFGDMRVVRSQITRLK